MLKIFNAPSNYKLAQKEFEEAQRALLKAQVSLVWANSQVAYYQGAVQRLKEFIKTEAP